MYFPDFYWFSDPSGTTSLCFFSPSPSQSPNFLLQNKTKTRCSSEAALSWLVENMQIQQQWPERPGTVGTKTSDDNCFGSELENENGKSPLLCSKISCRIVFQCQCKISSFFGNNSNSYKLLVFFVKLPLLGFGDWYSWFRFLLFIFSKRKIFSIFSQRRIFLGLFKICVHLVVNTAAKRWAWWMQSKTSQILNWITLCARFL